MRAWSIWTRLLLAVGVIACIAGGLLAAGMVLVLQAQRDFSTLAIDRIPRVALAGELAEFTGDLAALSAGIMAGALDPAAAPANPGPRVAAAAQGIGAVLASPGLRDIGGAAQLRAAEADLRHSLTDFTSVAAELDALATVLQSADEQLRWTHGDVQDQAGALLEDFSFNMDSQVLVLVSDPDPVRRAGAEVALERDRRLRDRLQRLATEAATLSALVLQARGVADPDALDQVERLGQDTLDTIALLRADLPVQTDVDLLLEGVDRLERLAQGPDGVFAMMRRQLNLREATVAHLSGAQASLGTMQAHLTEIGKAERLAALSLADVASHRIFSGAVGLGALSVLGAVVGGGILLLF
ncbi:MAG: two-component sensor histidine kinase, partial [Gemmobacter sp.]|nr:two-component sensor histidine kinase [Gemmobacter sp.]